MVDCIRNVGIAEGFNNPPKLTEWGKENTMPSSGKSTAPKTTIWRQGQGGKALVATLNGLPFGKPPIGTSVYIPNYGQARCSGHSTTGSGADETTLEVEFTLS